MEIEKLEEKINLIAPHDSEAILSFFQEFKNTIEVLERDHTRDEIINRIPKTRLLASDSPLVHRAQKWPKGYQGDFETIQHIIAQENKAIPNTFGHTIENFFLSSPICSQHINKVKCQSELISNALAINPNSRILSIGCGTSEDVKLNINNILKSNAEITLIDFDRDALDYSLASLEQIKEHIKIIQGNIYKISTLINDNYDLILIGGVFDYIDDKAIFNILSSLKENMNNGATIFFTNIKKQNPFRIYMEYLSDWILIERSDSEITSLLKNSGYDLSHVTIKTDDTNLAYLVEINYQGKP